MAARLLLALLLAVPGVVISTAAPASACSCVMSTVEQRAPETDAIFQGEVVGIEPGSEGRSVFTFDVLQVWKGDVGARVEVTSSNSGAACGLEMSPGQTRLVYADQRGARLTSGLCSAPFGSGGKAALTRLLGEPSAPSTGPTTDPSPDWFLLWGDGFLLDWLGLGRSGS